jgi:hypothetical protein
MRYLCGVTTNRHKIHTESQVPALNGRTVIRPERLPVTILLSRTTESSGLSWLLTIPTGPWVGVSVENLWVDAQGTIRWRERFRR